MFGFLPEDGDGDCALAMPGAVKIHVTARMSMYRTSFIFITFVELLVVCHSLVSLFAGEVARERAAS
jgi:hypothetical protein